MLCVWLNVALVEGRQCVRIHQDEGMEFPQKCGASKTNVLPIVSLLAFSRMPAIYFIFFFAVNTSSMILFSVFGATAVDNGFSASPCTADFQLRNTNEKGTKRNSSTRIIYTKLLDIFHFYLFNISL